MPGTEFTVSWPANSTVMLCVLPINGPNAKIIAIIASSLRLPPAGNPQPPLEPQGKLPSFAALKDTLVGHLIGLFVTITSPSEVVPNLPTDRSPAAPEARGYRTLSISGFTQPLDPVSSFTS